MKNKFSRILAVLAVVAMLCTVLPLGGLTGIVASAATNLVTNGDFETGTTSGWACNSGNGGVFNIVNTDPGAGAYSLSFDGDVLSYAWVYTSIRVEKNTDYILSFKAKVTNASVSVNFQTTSWGNSGIPKPTISGVGSTWTDVSCTFNSGENSQLLMFFQSGWSAVAGSKIYLDDVSVRLASEPEPEPEPEPSQNILTNGDFELGNWTGWDRDSWNACRVNETAKHTGSYGAQLTGSGYGGLLWRTVTVEPGATYELSMWTMTTAESSVGVNIKINDEKNGGASLGSKYVKAASWTKSTFEFTALSDKVYFMFLDGGGSTNSTTYLDDVTLVKIKSAPAFDGYIYNGNFESGDTSAWTIKGSGTAINTDAHSGNYSLKLSHNGAWGEAATQTVNVETNTNYTISFWVKRLTGTGAWYFYAIKGSNHNQNLASKYYNQTSTDWKQISFSFNSGSETSVFLKLCPEDVTSTFLIDDIVMIKEVDPSYDGYIYNGDFETGKAAPWSTNYSTIDTAAAYEGRYGIHVNDTTQHWAGYFNQSFTVKKKADYTLSLYIKCVRNGVNIKVYSKYADNTEYVATSKYVANKNWEKVDLTFNSGEFETLIVNFSSGNSAGGDEIYVDNISISKVGGEDPIPNNVLTGGYTSIREKVEGSQITSALGFRFDVKANGATVDAFNKYVSGSAIVTPFSDVEGDYKLIRAGAVMTNKADIGKDADTFVLSSVDGKKVLDIEAVYLCGIAADSFSFAVRIINIPDANLATNIYARPYYVYEDADGNEVTVYGETKSDNYAHVADPKAHIKVLAIGNSFSVDAMNNHLYKVLEDAGYQDIVLGNLYIGGCSLDTHWSNINSGLGNYTYYKNSGSGWTTTSNYKANTAIAEEDWDIITIQQASPDSGRPNTYINLNNIVSYVNENKTNPNARIYWHMTWAYDKDSTHDAFPNYDRDQMTMYTAITDTVKDRVLTNSLIDGVIPAGTAIQNMRTADSIEEAALCADGYHLSDNYGDYIAALTWYAYISGEDVSGITYQPGAVTAAMREDINAAVMGAMESPLAITKLDYDQTKSIKVLSIGHSFSIDVMGTYLYDMLEQAGYTDITLGYVYYPGCPLKQHWEWIESHSPVSGTQGNGRFSKNTNGNWETIATPPYTIDALRNEDWDFVTFQASPDYVGGQNQEYDNVTNMVNWIKDNALNANVDVKYHMIWSFSQDCELWSNMYHKKDGVFDQMTMYTNIVNAAKQNVVGVAGLTEADIIPSGTSVQNGRTSLIGDNFNEPVVPGTQADGYHLNTKYGDFTGSLTWACYFSGKDASTITSRSSGMTETEFAAIAEAVNNALADWDSVTESTYKN